MKTRLLSILALVVCGVLSLSAHCAAQMYKRYSPDGRAVYTNLPDSRTQPMAPIIKEKVESPAKPKMVTALPATPDTVSHPPNSAHPTRKQILLGELEVEQLALQKAQSAYSELEERIAVLLTDDTLSLNHSVLDRQHQQLKKSIANHQHNINLLREELGRR